MGRGLAPIVLGALLGRRLPVTHGTLRVKGLRGAITIRRDRWGIPHVDATSDADAWFGLGFCEGQDRAFQIESLLRVTRGTLSALVGAVALPVDRLSRRIGFARVARAELELLDAGARGALEAFARGVNAGRASQRPPHELALLRGAMTPFTAADAGGVLKLQTFALSSNWDVELARLHIAMADGADALADLDPAYPSWHPVAVPPGALSGDAIVRLAEEAAALVRVTAAGGSNGWALAASRTATGRPLLANDPHLAPAVPAPWYLAHLRTPEWSIAGAAFVGGPAFPAGHNGHGAWGVTAGLADTTDLFVEEIGPDGTSVREGDAFVPCEVRVERIEVKGAPAVEERVLVTRRGPIVGPALAGEVHALSFRATWLDASPAKGLLALERVRSFDDFRRAFSMWREVSLNMVYADASGTIGYQLVGEVPRRLSGDGSMPLEGRTAGAGWRDDAVPFDEMPTARDPSTGFVASANTKPMAHGRGPDLGVDFIDGYRLARIVERLAERSDWDERSTRDLQMDVTSIPWRELRTTVLDAIGGDPALADALALLGQWDGRIAASSPAAALFELFVADLTVRVAQLRAPKSYRYALGQGFDVIVPLTILAVRRIGHLVRILRERPEGWCGHTWTELIRGSMAAACATLAARSKDGRLPAWGEVRPLTFRHAFTGRRPIDRAFDLGPFPWGGDANTPSQAAVDPLAPTSNPLAVATLRTVIDVGSWDSARFVLPGGQSGNPCSRHYDDLLPLWRRGDAVPLAFSEEAVSAATRETLRLEPR
ncbi:MAG: penicillin acylase family protein [Chloroflexi bacterium]|nr:penicillin acylase family protein [Chloroflexota bacterium]